MKKESDIVKHVEEICNKVWGVPCEGNFSNMTTPRQLFYRPNNYRRQIKVKTKTNSTIKKIRGTIRGANFNSHTKLLSIKNYTPGITIQYGKNKLTAIYSQPIVNGVKTVHLIKRNSIKEIDHRITQIKEDIKGRLDTALHRFSRKFKIKIPYERIIWTRYEDYIKGEDYIDKIPKNVIIHDTVFKKVYGKGIEFIKYDKEEPIAHYKNYIKNHALKDWTPEITKELNNIYTQLTKMTGQEYKDIENWILNECNDIHELLQDTIKLAKVKEFTQEQRDNISELTFKRFGR